LNVKTDSFQQDITEILQAWRSGDEGALERLTPRVYVELRKAAKHGLRRERDGHSLQTTALINELYLRLDKLQKIDWQSRAHFFAVCARQMRRILIDQARLRQSQKRGSEAPVLSLEEAPELATNPQYDLLKLNDALESLAKVDERKTRVVEMRFFGGLRMEEIANVLNVSPETAARDWRLAKAWLRREMES
jgi:RNA polymerase sigma factor (TIGR02999 family)